MQQTSLVNVRREWFLHPYRATTATDITGERQQFFLRNRLAKLIAAALLCRSDGDRPCGRCKDCLAAIQGDHPDLIIIQKGLPIASDIKKDRSTIPVDDIREMIRLCSTHTFDGRARVILLLDAEKMTPQAQNCLLKTLEEPPENTYLLLVTDHPDALLTTVVSRTQTIRLHAWPDAYVRSILDARGIDPARASASVSEARGSIGKAIALASDEEYWSLRNEITGSFFGTLNRGEILSISSAWKDPESASAVLPAAESPPSPLSVPGRLPTRSQRTFHIRPEGTPQESSEGQQPLWLRAQASSRRHHRC